MKAVVAAVLALVLIAAVVFVVSRRPASETPPPSETRASAPPPVPKAVEPAPPPPPGGGPPKESARRTPEKAEPPPPPPPKTPALPTTARLILESDVPGASVFLNREYVGTTPLRLDKLEPGARQVKLTADGYEGIERSITLDAGDNPVTMRFREVRLDKRMAVSHKHGMGACEGMLIATVDGLAYETKNAGDAFTLPYAQVETLAVDYLEKNLRVKQRGGKTWNFTDKNAGNADALFVFQRDVEAARKKLAEGYAAVR